MWIPWYPTETENKHHICPIHQRHPTRVSDPRCTCSSSYTVKRKDPEDWTEEEREAWKRQFDPDFNPMTGQMEEPCNDSSGDWGRGMDIYPGKIDKETIEFLRKI